MYGSVYDLIEEHGCFWVLEVLERFAVLEAARGFRVVFWVRGCGVFLSD